MTKYRHILALLLVLAIAPTTFARARTIGPRLYPWQTPTCSAITGLDWFRYLDQLDPVRLVRGDHESFDVLPLAMQASAVPNMMYAVTTDGSILQSNDAGCTWRARTRVPELLLPYEPIGIVAKGIAPVYVWSGARLVRLTFGSVETFTLPQKLVALDVNPQSPHHLRAISAYGRAFESFDGGSTWTTVGDLSLRSIADAAFSPANFDHIVAAAYPGTMVSTDGGKTWMTSFSSRLQVHTLAFSPADANVVWAEAWNPTAMIAGIYRSTDGGKTFTVVRSAMGRQTFANSLAPHPFDSTRVAFTMRPASGVIAGVRLLGTDGIQTDVIYDNAEGAVWAPNGTLYYFVDVIIAR